MPAPATTCLLVLGVVAAFTVSPIGGILVLVAATIFEFSLPLVS